MKTKPKTQKQIDAEIAVDRAAIISWRVEWWIQECRPPSTWIDYGRKATERDLLLRIEELKTEVPSRQFRAISRFIEDRIVSTLRFKGEAANE